MSVSGFLTATITKNEVIPFLSKDPICRVGTIVEDEAYRSSGIGKTLMGKCREWALSSGATEVKLEVMEFNKNAQKFYAELGLKHSQE